MNTQVFAHFTKRSHIHVLSMAHLCILLLLSSPHWVNATDKDMVPYGTFKEWMAAIPQSKYGLRLLVCGRVQEQCFAMFKCRDGRIAHCFYNLKTGWSSPMSYDICDSNGKSLLYVGEDRHGKSESIEFVHETKTDSGPGKFVELFGWAESIKDHPMNNGMFLNISSNDKDISISIPDIKNNAESESRGSP